MTKNLFILCLVLGMSEVALGDRSNSLRDFRNVRRAAVIAAKQGAFSQNSAASTGLTTSNAGFGGYWHGLFMLTGTNCSGFNSTLNFRHSIATSRNQVAILTSHDGVLRGGLVNNGNDIQTIRTYRRRGIPTAVALVYRKPRVNPGNGDRYSQVGLGIAHGSCRVAYGANSIFAGF